ncbi:MAG: pentapeptide repeat-containing protein, partial [Reyranella sp.]|nr:pentapeptide repeat-containing protein [Reyranella sp.]
MAIEDPAYRSISQEEFLAAATTGRTFAGLLLPPDLALDELDLTESRFDRCHFQVPIIRSADFSGSEFRDCRFEPIRFASCRFAKTRFQGCTLFDVGKKKGCTFAFCALQAAEITKCNFSTSSFERCDLYGISAVDSGFRGAQFHQSTFTKTISRKSVLTKASFDRCNLSFADLSGLYLQNGEFLSCRFSETS